MTRFCLPVSAWRLERAAGTTCGRSYSHQLSSQPAVGSATIVKNPETDM